MTTDDSIVKFAQKFRIEAAATLVQIVRDESASPNARAQAARDILSYSDGKPGIARPITVADLAQMTREQRWELFQALANHYCADALGTLLRECCDQAVRQYALEQRKLALPPPKVGFTRGPRAQDPPPTDPVRTPHREALAGESEEAPAMHPSAEPAPAAPAQTVADGASGHPVIKRGANGIPINPILDLDNPRPNGHHRGPDWATVLNGYHVSSRRRQW